MVTVEPPQPFKSFDHGSRRLDASLAIWQLIEFSRLIELCARGRMRFADSNPIAIKCQNICRLRRDAVENHSSASRKLAAACYRAKAVTFY